MRKRSLWGAWIIAGILAAVSASITWAASPQQGEQPPGVTSTPTETSTPYPLPLPTRTPTATLLPLPPGGGRVVVQYAAVRVGPSAEGAPLGHLEYGEVVYPVARSANALWIAIIWGGEVAWVAADQVQWDPDLNIADLPIFIPPYTSTPLLNTPANTPTHTATPRFTATPQASPPVEEIAYTATLVPSPSPTRTPTTEPAVAIPPSHTPEPTTALLSPAPKLRPRITIPRLDPLIWMKVGIGLAVASLVLYGWNWAAGKRELSRYADGFVINECPVCQTGYLDLEEYTYQTLGIPRVRRSVRCDTCRSVLREVQPGIWRYTIDPFVNPALADVYNTQEFDDMALIALSQDAHQYKPRESEEQTYEMPSPDFQDTIEFLSRIEAQILTAQEAAQASENTHEEGEDAPDKTVEGTPPQDEGKQGEEDGADAEGEAFE